MKAAAPLAALCVALCALAASAGERIRDFRADVELGRDGRFEVVEHISYDFGSSQRHGIFRDIPVRYGRGLAADYRIDLEVLEVTDGAGHARPFEVSNASANRRVRIGTHARKVSGVQEYRIRYRVRRGILWFEDHDELYWNVTGLGWKVPIDRASVSVTLPVDDAAGAGPRTLCFTGERGSLETDCQSRAAEGRVEATATRALGPGEGLTLVVALEKGVLDEPSRLSRLLDRASDWLSLATVLPVLVLATMASRWWRHGRDPSGPVAIPVRYEPPEGMTPAELGTVLDEDVDLADITATILDLAVRGHLQIEEVESKFLVFLSTTDYALHRGSAPEGDLKSFEKKVLSGLFGGRRTVKVSELKNRFYTRLPGIRKALYDEVSAVGGWFPAPPDRIRTRYRAIAVVALVAGLVVGVVREDAPLLAAAVVSALIIGLFGPHMPRKTRKGRRAQQHILGFREFIERVEVDRLERLGMRSPEQFEKILPYAFVLGAADEWAEAFADLYREPPDWYRSSRGGGFRPGGFVEDVGRSLDSLGNAMRSRPSSSGGSGSSGMSGGFSGGGFGGGGGGSW